MGEEGGSDTPVLCEPQSKSSKYNKNFLKQCKTKQSKAKNKTKTKQKQKKNKTKEVNGLIISQALSDPFILSNISPKDYINNGRNSVGYSSISKIINKE